MVVFLLKVIRGEAYHGFWKRDMLFDVFELSSKRNEAASMKSPYHSTQANFAFCFLYIFFPLCRFRKTFFKFSVCSIVHGVPICSFQ